MKKHIKNDIHDFGQHTCQQQKAEKIENEAVFEARSCFRYKLPAMNM